MRIERDTDGLDTQVDRLEESRCTHKRFRSGRRGVKEMVSDVVPSDPELEGRVSPSPRSQSKRRTAYDVTTLVDGCEERKTYHRSDFEPATGNLTELSTTNGGRDSRMSGDYLYTGPRGVCSGRETQSICQFTHVCPDRGGAESSVEGDLR